LKVGWQTQEMPKYEVVNEKGIVVHLTQTLPLIKYPELQIQACVGTLQMKLSFVEQLQVLILDLVTPLIVVDVQSTQVLCTIMELLLQSQINLLVLKVRLLTHEHAVRALSLEATVLL
jgi:hypothetical protein